MEAIQELSGSFRLSQTNTMDLKSLKRDTLDLLEQFLLRVGPKQDLGLAKLLKGTRRFATADPTLAAPKMAEQALQFEIILG
jgi:hypothetical protein